MDLPKILLTGLFFLFFFGFPRVFGQLGLGHRKTLEKNHINKKNKKKQSWMDLPKILLTGLFFLFFFWFSSSFRTVGLGTPKNPWEKPHKQKKQKKTILNGLTQDSSHRIVFFVSCWFSLTFWTYGKVEMKKGKKHEKTKDAKTQRSQRPFLFWKHPYNLPRNPTVPWLPFPTVRTWQLHLPSCHDRS